jgi:hypothetical protein
MLHNVGGGNPVVSAQTWAYDPATSWRKVAGFVRDQSWNIGV